MKPLAKFLFDTSFDVEDAPAPAAAEAVTAAPPPPPAPPEPSFDAADLAAARQEGHAEGFAAGEATALASVDKAAADTLAVLGRSLATFAGELADDHAARARLMLETSLAALRRLMPELARRGGLGEIEGLLQQTLAELRDESRIVVRLNDQMLDGLRGRLDAVAQQAGFEGRLVLLADEEIAPGDCRIEWADGGVERLAKRVWDDIEAAVGRALATSPGTAGDKASLSTAAGA